MPGVRLVVGLPLTLAVIAAACSGAPLTPTERSSPAGSTPTPVPSSGITTPPTATTSPPDSSPVISDAPGPTGSAVLGIAVQKDVAFESSSINKLGMLDVYAPLQHGDWPVVVMYHGDPLSLDKNSYLGDYATRVAELGFVVFVPTWGHSGGAAYNALTYYEMGAADAAQAACAASFAAEHAADYGGNAASLTVFGHSAGAMVASVVVLAQPELLPGCLASATPQVDVLVPWEGDWLLTYPFWDSILAADPTVMETISPWAHLPAPADLLFRFVRSDRPGEGRSATDARGPDGWLAVRDPDGGLAATLEQNGAFDDNFIDPADSDAVLISRLEEQHADVTVRIMPDSTHNGLSDAGRQVFLDAFREIGGY